MSTLIVENIKVGTADSDSIQLSVDGTITFNKGVNIDSASVNNLSVNSSVGIGTTTPSHQLHLKENNTSGAGIFIEAVNDSAGYEIARDNATGYLDLKGTQNTYSGFTFSTTDGSGTTSERVRISNSGDVGIGTSSPKGQLHVHRAGAEPTFGGNVAAFSNTTGGASQLSLLSANTTVCDFLFSDTDNLSVGRIRYSHNNDTMQFNTNATIRMIIDANGNIGAPSGTNIYNASDERLKKDITGLSGSLSKVRQLRPVSFNWKAGFCPGEDSKTLYGFVAQEVETIDSNLVETFGSGSVTIPGEAGEPDTVVDDPLRINEKFIIPLLTKAIQEQQTQIEAQQATIEALEARLTALEGT